MFLSRSMAHLSRTSKLCFWKSMARVPSFAFSKCSLGASKYATHLADPKTIDPIFIKVFRELNVHSNSSYLDTFYFKAVNEDAALSDREVDLRTIEENIEKAVNLIESRLDKFTFTDLQLVTELFFATMLIHPDKDLLISVKQLRENPAFIKARDQVFNNLKTDNEEGFLLALQYVAMDAHCYRNYHKNEKLVISLFENASYDSVPAKDILNSSFMNKMSYFTHRKMIEEVFKCSFLHFKSNFPPVDRSPSQEETEKALSFLLILFFWNFPLGKRQVSLMLKMILENQWFVLDERLILKLLRHLVHLAPYQDNDFEINIYVEKTYDHLLYKAKELNIISELEFYYRDLRLKHRLRSKEEFWNFICKKQFTKQDIGFMLKYILAYLKYFEPEFYSQKNAESNGQLEKWYEEAILIFQKDFGSRYRISSREERDNDEQFWNLGNYFKKIGLDFSAEVVYDFLIFDYEISNICEWLSKNTHLLKFRSHPVKTFLKRQQNLRLFVEIDGIYHFDPIERTPNFRHRFRTMFYKPMKIIVVSFSSAEMYEAAKNSRTNRIEKKLVSAILKYVREHSDSSK